MDELNLEKLRGTTIGNMTTPHFIKAIHVTNMMDSKIGLIHCLKIDLSKEENLYETIASVEFYNVRENNRFDITMTQLISIAIDDIRERQWENCNYHVLDYESGNFDFFCEKFLIS